MGNFSSFAQQSGLVIRSVSYMLFPVYHLGKINFILEIKRINTVFFSVLSAETSLGPRFMAASFCNLPDNYLPFF